MQKKEMKEENEKTLENNQDTTTQKIDFESIQETPKIRKRGRPKGSKNKKSKIIPDKRKFQQEWFETNTEFKARVAEEMKMLNAQAA